MARRRKYVRKTPYKRRYYRKRSTLKKSNIFRKRSAKSQAKQIYALNKKVNRMYKNIAPEKQPFYLSEDVNFFHFSDFTPANADNVNRGRFWQTVLFHSMLTGYSTSNPAVWSFDGQLVRILNKIKLMIKIQGPDSLSSYLEKIIYRITIGRLKGPCDSTSFGTLHRAGYGTDHDVTDVRSIIYGPLGSDITTQYNIVYDKIGSFSNKYKTPSITIPIYLYGGTYRRDSKTNSTNYSSIMKNDYVINVTAGWTSRNVDTDASSLLQTQAISCSMGCKFAFVDDNDHEVDDARLRYITPETFNEYKERNRIKIEDHIDSDSEEEDVV